MAPTPELAHAWFGPGDLLDPSPFPDLREDAAREWRDGMRRVATDPVRVAGYDPDDPEIASKIDKAVERTEHELRSRRDREEQRDLHQEARKRAMKSGGETWHHYRKAFREVYRSTARVRRGRAPRLASNRRRRGSHRSAAPTRAGPDEPSGDDDPPGVSHPPTRRAKAGRWR
jgi:hypothetical protein